jgi:LysM repeat protein
MRALFPLLVVTLLAGPVHAGSRDAVLHTIKPGDTLYGLARRYHTTIDAIKRRNHMSSDLLRDGRTLLIPRAERRHGGARTAAASPASQSRGLPYAGRLLKGVQLPPNQAYVRRRPFNAWGTSNTVAHVKRIAEVVRRRYPRVHQLAIGDISARGGGRLIRHASHQSGRDVDIGFYFERRPRGYPNDFVRGTAANLDMEANWLMLERFCDTQGSRGGVEKIFLVASLQKLFHQWGKRQGASRATLDRMFQYGGNPDACIRHQAGHDDHIHVRFKCPPGDRACAGRR